VQSLIIGVSLFLLLSQRFSQPLSFLRLCLNFKLGKKTRWDVVGNSIYESGNAWFLWFSEGVVSRRWTMKPINILTWTPASLGKIRLLRPCWTRDKYSSNNKQERHKTHFEERSCQYWNVNIQQCFSLKNGRCELVCNLLPSVFLREKCFFFSGFTS